MMNRRAFLSTMVGGVAASAAVRTWPFRVFSFPSEIVVAHWYDDWSNFDIAKTVPVHLDRELARRCTFAVPCSIISSLGSFLDPEVLKFEIARHEGQI